MLIALTIMLLGGGGNDLWLFPEDFTDRVETVVTDENTQVNIDLLTNDSGLEDSPVTFMIPPHTVLCLCGLIIQLPICQSLPALDRVLSSTAS